MVYCIAHSDLAEIGRITRRRRQCRPPLRFTSPSAENIAWQPASINRFLVNEYTNWKHEKDSFCRVTFYQKAIEGERKKKYSRNLVKAIFSSALSFLTMLFPRFG